MCQRAVESEVVMSDGESGDTGHLEEVTISSPDLQRLTEV